MVAAECAIIFILLSSFVSGYEVRIGHLTPPNSQIVGESSVLQMCAMNLKTQGVLPENISFKIVTMSSCTEFDGVENAAILHHNHNVTVYFGPGCSNEMLVIGRLVPRWNVPIIAHMSGDDQLEDRRLYKSLATVALTSATEIARAVAKYVGYYGWQKVGLVGSRVSHGHSSGLVSLRNTLKAHGMSVAIEIEFDQFASVEDIMKSDELNNLANNARIVVCEMGMDLHDSTNFLIAAYRSQMKTNEYVYILPWSAPILDHFPWEGANLDNPEVRLAFDNVIVFGTMVYMPLYDALYLYGLALRSAVDDAGSELVAHDGIAVWSKMIDREFVGVSGTVLMNHKAVRVPSYAAYFVRKGMLTLVMEIEAKLITHNCTSNNYGCSALIGREVFSNYWTTSDGQMPPDMPRCGFDGALCDRTSLIVGLLLGIGTVILIVLVILYRRREKQRSLQRMPWRIPRETVRMGEEINTNKSEKSLLSDGEGGAGGSHTSRLLGANMKKAIVDGTKFGVKEFTQSRNISFTQTELTTLNLLKRITHDNLNMFYGICFNQRNEFLVMWVLCDRGSLEDILFNEELKLGQNFQSSFAKDVTRGLDFLHSSLLGVHGMMHASNCLVDGHWTVKLSDYGYLQFAPEIVKIIENTGSIPHGTPESDVYGLGMILYQILFRVEPYHDRNETVDELLILITSQSTQMYTRPAFPRQPTYTQVLLSIIESCWLESAADRPPIKKVKKVVDTSLKSKARGTLVDEMVKMMEQYTNNLEALVKERTALLEEAQQQADRLLNQMLPKSVADDLKVGKVVAPQYYSCVTVLFSDIRGFTTLCSTSTPLQIVTFLNDLFSGFDEIISKHDAYKVETIGDAYMIVSGLPKFNGNNHVSEMSEIALKMRDFVKNFKLAHRPNEQMAVRIGFHSGSVAAGVVGRAAPRYCLFGDTVNVASRMESTGEAEKIQISTASQTLLQSFFPKFVTSPRGDVEVKGKGKCATFWLEGKK
uniref:Guanylate cyclase n=1 Tax=Plectus sambesii TaxID=2011161 RepID=A0A914W8W2_9BILA